MDWEKTNLELAAYLDTLLAGYHAEKKPMFGCPVYFINGNMWTGVKGQKVFMRLSADDRALVQAEYDEVKPFEPRPDFFMKEYVELPESLLTDEEFIRKWMRISYTFAQTIPAKEKKEKPPKRK
ncbi:MAG: TfoX/Sxy family protein [Eubacteriales bacterium]